MSDTKPLHTLLAELDAHYARVGEVFRAGLTQGDSIWSDEMPAVNALVNAYPTLRAAIAQQPIDYYRTRAALANVSGALCDAGGVVPDEAQYGEAVRAIVAERDALRADLAQIHERREPLAGDAETDGADPAVVRLALLQCLRAWEPAARVLGNVRACDAERAIVEGQDRVVALEQERDEARAERNARARDVMHLETENERLRALINDAATPWLALDPGVAWEGAIDAAMMAACAEITRLRTVVAQQREALRAFLNSHVDDEDDEDGVPYGCECLTCKKARAVLAQEVPGE